LRKILAGAALLSVISPAIAQPALQPGPLATRPGWELGVQAAHYEYLEPDFAKLSGSRGGVAGAYTFANPRGLFSRIDVRESYGSLTYRGSGTKNNVPDLIFETRVVAGLDFFPGSSVSLSPYFGLGYRYLYNDLQGYSSSGAAGYRRYSNYLYGPLGLTMRIHLGDGWVLAPTVELDVFIRGKQITKLSDTGLGFTDVTNSQDTGRGHRVSLMVEKGPWVFGAWTHYWHIEDSDLQFAGVVGGISRFGGEPENYTRESGLELRYRF
jgi:hypothetical protein